MGDRFRYLDDDALIELLKEVDFGDLVTLYRPAFPRLKCLIDVEILSKTRSSIPIEGIVVDIGWNQEDPTSRIFFICGNGEVLDLKYSPPPTMGLLRSYEGSIVMSEYRFPGETWIMNPVRGNMRRLPLLDRASSSFVREQMHVNRTNDLTKIVICFVELNNMNILRFAVCSLDVDEAFRILRQTHDYLYSTKPLPTQTNSAISFQNRVYFPQYDFIFGGRKCIIYLNMETEVAGFTITADESCENFQYCLRDNTLAAFKSVRSYSGGTNVYVYVLNVEEGDEADNWVFLINIGIGDPNFCPLGFSSGKFAYYLRDSDKICLYDSVNKSTTIVESRLLKNKAKRMVAHQFVLNYL